MPKICDMGQDGFYFPSEGRRAEDFFALKNPTANLGTKGQHATSRPLKALGMGLIDILQDRDRWRALVEPSGSIKCGEFLN
jgi:hypothetical protein